MRETFDKMKWVMLWLFCPKLHLLDQKLSSGVGGYRRNCDSRLCLKISNKRENLRENTNV
jgi:hypothetical protein